MRRRRMLCEGMEERSPPSRVVHALRLPAQRRGQHEHVDEAFVVCALRVRTGPAGGYADMSNTPLSACTRARSAQDKTWPLA